MTGTIAWLAAAVAAFVGSHFALSSRPVRRRLVARVGDKGFLGAYSVLALVLLVWVVAAYRAAPEVPVWTPPIGLRHLSLGLMPFASILLVAGFTTPGPTAVSLDGGQVGGGGALEPRGIQRVTRHPVMWAIAIWSISHLLANGDAASMILFGGLGTLALGGAMHIDAKKRRLFGPRWGAYARAASFVPLAAIAAGRTRVGLGDIGGARLAGGLALYAALIWVHPWLFGAVVWPL